MSEIRRSITSFTRYVSPHEDLEEERKREEKGEEEPISSGSSVSSSRPSSAKAVVKIPRPSRIGVLSETNMILNHANNAANSGFFGGGPVLRVAAAVYSPRGVDRNDTKDTPSRPGDATGLAETPKHQ
jgi:hypothetical protein